MRLVEEKIYLFDELSDELRASKIVEKQKAQSQFFCSYYYEEVFRCWLDEKGFTEQAKQEGWEISEFSFDYSHSPELIVEDKDEKVIMSMEVGMNGSRGDDLAVELFDYLESEYALWTSAETAIELLSDGDYYYKNGEKYNGEFDLSIEDLRFEEKVERLNYLLIKRFDLEKQGKMLSKNQVKELAELKAGLLG